MSRKYISQVNNSDFIYPNNYLAEYDIQIVHDLNENSVSGTVATFSATTFNSTGITVNYNITWNKNNADVFINQAGNLNLFSIHMLANGQDYYKPFRMVHFVSTGTTGTTTTTVSGNFTVLPSLMGLGSFTAGEYNFEIRFIGKRAIYLLCQTLNLSLPTPTPTPTLTPTPTVTTQPPTDTPTPTPTNTNTPTPTVTNTPTPTPTQTSEPNPCVCVEITVTGTTAPEEGFAGSISYNDCNNVLVVENFATPGTRYRCISYTGSIIQVFSSTNIVYGIASGFSCTGGTCPTGETITCICYSYLNETEGSLTIDYVACDGTQPIIGVPGGSSGTFCARIGQYTGDTGLFITTCTPTIYCQDNPVSGCDSCGATPTPTPTPTNTNTPTPTGTNTPTPTVTTQPPTDTPTPTPTVTNTPTPTPTLPSCVTSVTFDVDSAGDVRYVDCCGNTIYITYGIGPQVINDCIEYGSVFAVGASISNIVYGITSCVCPPTPTPTNTNTPTPTPTVTTQPPTDTPTPTPTDTPTPTPTDVPPAYNYYTFAPCTGGAGTDYRSILSLQLGDIYTFQAYPPDRACYEITSITAPTNTNDLPTIYGPLTDCNDENCQQV